MHIENLKVGDSNQLLADTFRFCKVVTLNPQSVLDEERFNKPFLALYDGNPNKKPFFPFTHAHGQIGKSVRVILFGTNHGNETFWAKVSMNELHARPATVFELLPLQHILPDIFQDEYIELIGTGSRKIQEFGVVHYPTLFINRKSSGAKAHWTLSREDDDSAVSGYGSNVAWAAVVKENWRPLKVGDRVQRAIDPLKVASCGEMFPVNGEIVGFTKDYTQQIQAVIQTKDGDRECYVSNLALENEAQALCENKTNTEPAFTVGDWVMVSLDENTKDWMRGKGALAGGVMRIRTLWRNYGVNSSFSYGDWMATLEDTNGIGGYQTSISNLQPAKGDPCEGMTPEQKRFVTERWREFMQPLHSR